MDRRTLISAGALGSAGLSLLLDRPAGATRPRPRRARSCLLLWLQGGPASLDLWDLKPAAPAEVRGPFRPLRTRVPGLEVCEHLPRLARMADRFCLLRSVTHSRLDHESAAHLVSTGWDTWPAQPRPAFGTAFQRLEGAKSSPSAPARLPARPVPASPAGPALDLALTTELGGSPVPSSLEARLVAARRLVETGTRCVTVVDPGWDTHADHFAQYEQVLLPRLDAALYRLLSDLEDRGLLETTLVVVMGEFSRTPRINGDAGRHHWPHVQTVLLAGGGIPGGTVVGASDAEGAYPAERPLAPADLAATLYHQLGIPLDATVTAAHGLPVPLLPAGARPIPELI